jgi:signal transduction histidine kinase
MRTASFRIRVTLMGGFLVAAVVIAVLVTTYLLVMNAMTDVATRETSRLAQRAADEVRRAVTQAQLQALSQGLTGKEAQTAADVMFAQSIPERFGVAQGFLEGHFGFYEPPDTEPRYLGDQLAANSDADGRLRAMQTDAPVQTHLGGQSPLTNLLFEPDLGIDVVHVPFQRPNEQTWVLDVVYYPVRETQTVQQLRVPMMVLSLLAVLLSILIIGGSASWVLRLIDELREAADSIKAGQLNIRLPEGGANEIGDLARSLNGLIDRLRHRSEAQTRFVADASHELATPVAGIRGYVSILRSWGADDPDVREESLDAIDRESWRMMRLTRELLAMIRSEHEMEFHSVRHDVNALCREVLANAATRYAERDIEFVGPEGGPLVILADAERMEEVIGILVDNAAKYTDDGGIVSVTTVRRKGDVLVRVSDTGHGIAPEDLPNIFDRFYRSDSSRSDRPGGFGLGLAIAKRIIESVGGLIDVESELGKGTTFTIRVPRGRD